mmetsp:Transcript_29366/g.44332  ORF Transcript_29366/g.44332 Transcript_29366/m.44332 type:complete len:110 (+) Transcript_29366:1886-2215(+)
MKAKRHFNHVDWVKMKDNVRLQDLKNRLKRYQNLHLEGNDINQPETLGVTTINSKIAQAEQEMTKPLADLKNLEKMVSGETFKGQKRKSIVNMAPMYQANPMVAQGSGG